MAFEKIGLGSVLTTDAKPMIRETNRARDAYTRFSATANQVPQSLSRIARAATTVTARMRSMTAGVGRGARMMSTGFRDIGMGLAPLSLGLGVAVNQAANFEKQMSGVGAVSRANQKDMSALKKEARRMGIVSVFSASQAGEGMEFMARAGAKPTEIIAGLSGVMNAAAADSISLGQSADIVSRVVKGMGLEWSQAGNVADNLALASASANTNIIALGESFVYGVATSKSMGISLEETTAIFAKLADAGLRGSLGGTAYANMMTRLAKPSSKAQKILKEFNVKLEDSQGRLRKVASIASDFNKKLSQIKSTTQRQAIAQEVFGRRGVRAFNALATAGEESTLSLEESLRKASEGEGAAAEMARRRLDNFSGAMTLLKSSLEGLSINFFEPLLKPFATSTRHFTDGLNNVLLVLSEINDLMEENPGEKVFLSPETVEKYGDTAVQIAFGLRDAIDTVSEAWETLTTKVKEAGKWVEKTFGVEGAGNLRNIVKMGTLLLIAGALLTPLILGLAMLKFVVGGAISVLVGLGSVLASVFLPVLIIVGALIIAWQFLKKENESFFETAERVWGDLKTWITDVWENVLKPFWEGLKTTFIPIIEDLGKTWRRIVHNVKMVFSDLFEFLFGGFDRNKVDWKEVGQTAGSIIGAIAKAIMTFVEYAVPVIASIAIAIWKVTSTVWKIIKWVITQIAEHFAKLASGFEDILGGNFLRGLAKIGTAILDFMLKPLRLVLEGVLALGDLLDIDVPPWVRTFAKEGTFGLAFGVPAEEKTFKTRKDQLASLGIVEEKKAVDPLDSIKALAKLEKPVMPSVGPKESATKVAKENADMQAKKEAKNKEKEEGLLEKGIKAGTEIAKKVLGDQCTKVEANIGTKVNVDGEELTVASSRHKVELQERAGFKSTPWQRRAMLEHGAAPIKRG